MWNSRMKQCSTKLCINCRHFCCGTQDLSNSHQSFVKLQRLLLLWNSRIKQCSSMLFLKCIDLYCGTQKSNNARTQELNNAY
uniref:Uncharacterized protein n=2 Tax=Lactuca sativa TaxID=4236 RepID=A0A9R1UC61_LACSA|nr:hypothetical protein LSAT_V11C000506700 [Lactuca sativa]KAJ0184430.1 hypothetical protein LSAT_V11C000506720 [Lactuca sativa]